MMCVSSGKEKTAFCACVAEPKDPYVFGPPGAGSVSQSYGSGSGSFYHQAKIARKTLIPTVTVLIETSL
jgi:hypothetical protein